MRDDREKEMMGPGIKRTLIHLIASFRARVCALGRVACERGVGGAPYVKTRVHTRNLMFSSIAVCSPVFFFARVLLSAFVDIGWLGCQLWGGLFFFVSSLLSIYYSFDFLLKILSHRTSFKCMVALFL